MRPVATRASSVPSPAAGIPSRPPAAGGSREPHEDPLVGRTINERVKIIRTIARGGMGKVYYGEQLTLGRPCAIKVLDPHVAAREGDDFNKRFLLEASVSAKLKHPNVVTIFDYGETEDGLCYIAMEYLQGKTLGQELKDIGRMPASRALNVFKQVCRALREAHAIGVVHRDMKPGNIFLVKSSDTDEGDFVKVLDFGLVKETKVDDEKAGQTQVGAIMGSPRYMAPEQIQGKDVDGRTDIYSSGAVLYAMICGKPPFDKPNEMSTMMAHVSEPVPLMGDVVKDLTLPMGVEDIVYRCLAKDPAQRFASMEELLVAIKMVEQGKAPTSASGGYPSIATTSSGSGGHMSPYVSGTGSGSVSGVVQEPRKSKPVVALVAIAAVAAAAAVGLVVSQNRTAPPEPQPATSTTTAPTPAPSPSVSAEAPPPIASATLHVETEPPGAKVKEDMAVVCETTPCNIVYKGAQADAGIEHLLIIAKPDYRMEKRIVKVDGKPLVVRLRHD